MEQQQYNLMDMNETHPPAEPVTMPSAAVVHNPYRYNRFNRGNLILAGLFAAGLLGIYLLSLRGGPAIASAEQKTTEMVVDNAITRLNSGEFSELAGKKAMEVVNNFYSEAKQRQIPVNKLATNPFVFKPPAETVPTDPVDHASSIPIPSKEPSGLDEAMKDVEQLRLQSVLTGSHGAMAMISNNLLTEGQTIKGWTVVEIHPRHVILKWNERQYVLKMAK